MDNMMHIGIREAIMNCPPVLIKDSYFEQWKEQFIDFIANRENGEDMIKSFTEGPMRIPYTKMEKDYTSEEIKSLKADKEASSNLLYALPSHIRKDIHYLKDNPMLLWNELTTQMTGSEVEFKKMKKEDSQETLEQIKVLEAENESLKEKLVELTNKLADMDRLLKVEREEFKKERTNLFNDKKCHEKKILSLSTRISEEKKIFELKCIKLSKQNSDFEKVLFLEKERIEKERAENEKKCKSFEAKNGKLSKKISELQKELDVERKEHEKRKVADFQARSVKDKFSSERKIFQCEIQKLTRNLAVLSADIMKEKKNTSDIQKKFDRLSKERNVLFNKVKQLQDIHHHVSCKEFDRSKGVSKNQIRYSNPLYDHSADSSDDSESKPSESKSSDIPVFKRVKMVWKVKGSTPEKDGPKSFVPKTNFKKNNAPKGKSFVKPNPIYSENHLIRLAQKKICCSYCGTNDFVEKDYVQYWYGTYRVPSTRAPPNKPGPKFRWVPKST